jgi:serine/threonine protein kinase
VKNEEGQQGPSGTGGNASLGAWVSGVASPREVGSYALGKKIGEGGMGIVLEATHKLTGQRAAVKMLRGVTLASDVAARFANESKVLARLQHPCIAGLYDAGSCIDPVTADRVPYFAMEYIEDGRPITRYCEEEGLTVPERLGLFVVVCDAVQHGHSRAVIHRDLKPANILVGPQGLPKLIDFGISRTLEESGAAREMMTGTGQVLGTPQYMSPEQIAGDQELVDVRTDVYSLGVLLYELITGSVPYSLEGKGIVASIAIVKDAPPPRLRGTGLAREVDLEAVVQKAMAKDLADRYASAAELAKDLRRYLADEPVEAREYSRTAELVNGLRRLLRRNRVIAGAAVMLVAVVGTSWVEGELRSRVFWSNAIMVYDSMVARLVSAAPPDLSRIRLIVGDSDRRPQEAEANGEPMEDEEDLRSARPMVAKVAADVAEAGALVAILDYFFMADTPWDAKAVEHLRRAVGAGMPVVIGDPHWHADTEALISRAVVSVPGVYRGAVSYLRAPSEWVDSIATYSECEQVIFPSAGLARGSVALTAYALMQHGPIDAAMPPGLSFSPTPAKVSIDLGVSSPLPGAGGVREDGERRVVGTVPVDSFELQARDLELTRARRGEMYARARVDRWPMEVYTPVMRTYEQFGAMNAGERRAWLEGCAVVIGDIAPLEFEAEPDGRGGLVAGCVGHAQALAELLAGTRTMDVRRELSVEWPWLTFGAACGMGGAVVFGRGMRGRAVVLLVGSGIVAIALSVAVFESFGVMASQLTTLLVIVVTFGIAVLEQRFASPARRMDGSRSLVFLNSPHTS